VVEDVTTREYGGSCRRAGYPSRLLEVAESMPRQSIAGSVCNLSEMDLVQAIAERIADAACAD
jgi:hypothetical protein